MSQNNHKRVMVIMAHPDDPEFFCGGTVARWAREGAEVTYVIITNGNKGSDDPNMTPERLVEIREVEQRRAAEVLGVQHIEFMGYPDGELAPDLCLRCDLARLIRQHRPDAVICPDPTTRITTFGSINHADHRAAGDAALDAIFPTARNPFYCRDLLEVEGLTPFAVREVYLAGTTQPDTCVDVTDTLELKIQAVRQHVSQIQKPEELAERIRSRLKVEQNGQVRYQETFRRLELA
jgi:LmbE family N-acetylglucosaminyl deacetylase